MSIEIINQLNSQAPSYKDIESWEEAARIVAGFPEDFLMIVNTRMASKNQPIVNGKYAVNETITILPEDMEGQDLTAANFESEFNRQLDKKKAALND